MFWPSIGTFEILFTFWYVALHIHYDPSIEIYMCDVDLDNTNFTSPSSDPQFDPLIKVKHRAPRGLIHRLPALFNQQRLSELQFLDKRFKVQDFGFNPLMARVQRALNAAEANIKKMLQRSNRLSGKCQQRDTLPTVCRNELLSTKVRILNNLKTVLLFHSNCKITETVTRIHWEATEFCIVNWGFDERRKATGQGTLFSLPFVISKACFKWLSCHRHTDIFKSWWWVIFFCNEHKFQHIVIFIEVKIKLTSKAQYFYPLGLKLILFQGCGNYH